MPQPKPKKESGNSKPAIDHPALPRSKRRWGCVLKLIMYTLGCLILLGVLGLLLMAVSWGVPWCMHRMLGGDGYCLSPLFHQDYKEAEFEFHGWIWNPKTWKEKSVSNAFLVLYHNYLMFSRVNWYARTSVRNARELEPLQLRVALEKRGHVLVSFPDVDSYDGNRDEQRFRVAFEKLIRQIYPEQKALQIKLPALRTYNNRVPLVHADNTEVFCDSSFYECDEEIENKLKNADQIQILGLWKPINNTRPLCKGSLALVGMDSMESSDVKKVPYQLANSQRLDTSTEGRTSKFFTGNRSLGYVYHNPKQEWWYYPDMVNSEAILFLHYHSALQKQTPHVSFDPEGCEGPGERSSLETRVWIGL